MVHRIEAHQGGEQAHIGLGQVFPGQVAIAAQQVFQVVQFVEHFVKRSLVGFLRSGKACAIHAVVHRRVDAFVQRLDGRAQRLWVQVQRIAGQFVERAVEDADDLRRLVVDDAFLFLVPQHRYSHTAGVVRVILGVALVQVLQCVEVVTGGALLLVEGPAMVLHQPADHRHVDQRLQALEGTEDQGAVRPWAGQRDVQVVTASFGSGQLIAALGVFAFERAVLAVFIPLVMPAAVDQKAHGELLGTKLFVVGAQSRGKRSNN
ncbi:hypothetical protein D3C76_1010880 [compost metagenome]